MTTALTKTSTGLSKKELAESRLYPNIKTPAQAAVVMAKAKAYGLCATTVADGLFFVSGKPALSAQLIGTLLKKSGKYDFRVRKKTEEVCEIEFFEVIDGKRESLGIESFSMKMATRAGLVAGQNWKKFPEAMLWARCLTAGVRARCPDALGGNPVYSVEELSPSTEVDAEGRPIIEAEVVDVPATYTGDDVKAWVEKAKGDLGAILNYNGVDAVDKLSAEQRSEVVEAMKLKIEVQ